MDFFVYRNILVKFFVWILGRRKFWVFIFNGVEFSCFRRGFSYYSGFIFSIIVVCKVVCGCMKRTKRSTEDCRVFYFFVFKNIVVEFVFSLVFIRVIYV